MHPTEINKKLLSNFIWLIVTLSLPIAIVFFGDLYFKKFQTIHHGTDDALGAVTEGLGPLLLGGLVMVTGIILWTINVVSDIANYKENVLFVWLNIFLLLIPYGPIVGFGLYKW